MADTPKTVKGVLEAATAYLEARDIEQARLACELLVARLLNCKRLELYLRYDAVLGEKRLAAMRRGVTRVAAGEPVQYVLGRTEFMGHALTVDKRALIPRPETEGLVEKVLATDALWARQKPAVVDVGTGTGCIVISLALARPDGLYIGLDVSADALELARANAAALGVGERVAFDRQELSEVVEPGTLDAIVSNPPYIPTGEWEQLPVHIRDHEPRLALDGGPDGLAVIETLVQDAGFALKPGGFLFLEIGAQQAGAVRDLMAAGGFDDVSVDPDLSGRDRVVTGTLGR